MYILEKIISDNYDLGNSNTFENDSELDRTILILDFLEPYYKKFIEDFNIKNKNHESFYNVAFHSIIVNLGRGDNYNSPYLIPDINQDNDMENDDIENIYGLMDYFFPSLENFEFIIEKQNSESSTFSKDLIEVIYYQNKKNRIEKLHVSTIKKVAQNLLEIELHKCLNILQCYFNGKIEKSKYYIFFDVEEKSSLDEIERANKILNYVLNINN
ncbi:hypothetical protein [Flavobacterium sp.]|uniref:hypothetical protein n=1 Tax=Flavobacterium sp. TaxID=239 RepID=UPI003BDDBC88